MTYDGCKSINTGFKRKINRAKKNGQEMIELPVQMLKEVSDALDYLVWWRRNLEHGTLWKEMEVQE